MKAFLRWLAARLLGRARLDSIIQIYHAVFALTVSLKTLPLAPGHEPSGEESASRERMHLTIEGREGILLLASQVKALRANRTPAIGYPWRPLPFAVMPTLGVLFQAGGEIMAVSEFSLN